MNKKTLKEIADRYGTDKGQLKHNYTITYSKYLQPIRDEKLNFLEIGVAEGSSVLMWSEYLKNSSIIGADYYTEKQLIESYNKKSFNNKNINVEENMRKISENKNCKLIQINQASRESLENIKEDFDVIIDDGSHVSGDILLTLGVLSRRLKSGGYYFIEDLNCIRTPDNRGESNQYSQEHFECKNALLVLFDWTDPNGRFESEILSNKENDYINNNFNILSITKYNRSSAGVMACLKKI